tara:strand:+ start:578 stop:715 length:138 start_codon:yes stop_codon:yes gene_type:complete
MEDLEKSKNSNMVQKSFWTLSTTLAIGSALYGAYKWQKRRNDVKW